MAKLTWLLVIYAFGHLVAAVYYFWNAVYLQKGYPYTSYLCIPSARFTDYDNMILMCRNLNPYHDHTRSGYPPFANLLFYLFSGFSMHVGYIIFVLIPVVFACWAVNRLLIRTPALYRCLAVVFLVVFSYPFLFTFDRGNVEFYIMIFLGTFFVLYNSPNPVERDIAMFGLAAGICIKIYPVLLLIIPFKDKRFIDCYKVIVLCLLLTVGSAAAFSGGALNALSDFRQMIATTDELVKSQLQYAHGNAGMFYAGVMVLKLCGATSLLKAFNDYYWLMAFAVLGTYSWLIATSRMAYWASASCIVALFCLVPSLSNDYRTTQILIPMLLFAASRTPSGRAYSAITLIFGLLLVPRNYLILFPEAGPGDVGIGSIITPVLLFALMNIVLFAERRRWQAPDAMAARRAPDSGVAVA